MLDVLTRAAQPTDIAAVTAIYAHAVTYGTASFETVAPDIAEMMRRYEKLRAGAYPYIVAQCADAVIGYAYAGPYRERAAYRWSLETSIYVAPQFHGRGVGRTLLDTLIREAERGGFRQMIAVIGDSANMSSIRLHAAAGFRLVGTLDSVGFKFGRWLDSVLMQRPLGEGAASVAGNSRES